MNFKQDFTIWHPVKNDTGKYKPLPYSFCERLTSFTDPEDLFAFLKKSYFTEDECKEACYFYNIGSDCLKGIVLYDIKERLSYYKENEDWEAVKDCQKELELLLYVFHHTLV